jgi:hypothetical protein
MKISVLQKVISAAFISLGAIAVSLPAQAGTIINGWNYARDDYSYDGTGGGDTSATSRYDIYGVGIKEVGSEIWVGITASMPLTGIGNGNAQDGNIGWGDLLFDFNYGKSGNNFLSAQGSMIGVRFAGTNDSGASTTGVYRQVTAKSVTSTNSGFSSVNHYKSAVPNAVIGDLPLDSYYYTPYAGTLVPNVIGTYSNRVGDVTALSASDLSSLPNPALASANLTKFGFKFDRPTGFSGNYAASLFLECFNDSIAVTKAVPVPPAIAGIMAAAAFGGWRASRKKQIKVA